MTIVTFGVLPDAAHPTCEPLIELKTLLRSGRLPRAASLWGRLPGRGSLSPKPSWPTSPLSAICAIVGASPPPIALASVAILGSKLMVGPSTLVTATADPRS
jgi:hypothetical protein